MAIANLSSCQLIIRRPYLSPKLRGFQPLYTSNLFQYSLLRFYSAKERTPDPSSPLLASKPSLWSRIKAELTHYKNGSIKFGQETKTSFNILLQLYKVGSIDSLTRRERLQLARTGGDLLRLIPFSIFVIVPFLEFLLPFFIKLFPNMLPSTFEDLQSKQNRLTAISKSRKVALDALHLILIEMQAKDQKVPFLSAHKLAEILKETHISTASHDIKERLASLGDLVRSSQIGAYTPESISSVQLHAICTLFGISSPPSTLPFARIINTRLTLLGSDAIRRYQLKTHLQKIQKDDALISAEGVETLLPAELVQACHMRGIPSIKSDPTKSEEEHLETLRADLQQWLDLTHHYGFPMLLVILSTAMAK